VYKQQQLVIQIGEYSEKFKRIFETIAYPFKTMIEAYPGRMPFPFGKHIKQIATPEPHTIAKPDVVSGDPVFPAPDALANQEQRRGSFTDGFNDGGFLVTFKGTGETAHHPQPGKGLADIFLGF
jgi:hypothetical protein